MSEVDKYRSEGNLHFHIEEIKKEQERLLKEGLQPIKKKTFKEARAWLKAQYGEGFTPDYFFESMDDKGNLTLGEYRTPMDKKRIAKSYTFDSRCELGQTYYSAKIDSYSRLPYSSLWLPIAIK